jgi:hypothetical protein
LVDKNLAAPISGRSTGGKPPDFVLHLQKDMQKSHTSYAIEGYPNRLN